VDAVTRVAVAQMTSTDDVEKNLATCRDLVQRAAAQGAQVVVLPENFAFLGVGDGDVARVREPIDGPLFARYRALARDAKTWVCCGGFAEDAGDGARAYNAHVVVDDEGAIRAHYRKLHLFDVELPTGQKLQESARTAPGAELVVVDSPAGKLGLTICYDLRFPAQYEALVDRGAQVLLVPAAFTLSTGKDHWEVLLRARAIEGQAYVVAAAQTGRHNERRESWGHAMIVDPWGAVVAQCSEGVGIAVADVDVDLVAAVRRRIPVAAHRRRDVY
jgi:deaminated glutathione amidase